MRRSPLKPALLPLVPAVLALASFWPSLRIDHDDRPTNLMLVPAMTLGPRTPSGQPVYVVFEDDSTIGGYTVVRSDIMLQRSTDAGRTWLPEDVLVHRGSPFASAPDITTDPQGNIYVAYRNKDSTGSARCYHCVRSSDGGATWSAPVSIDSGMSGLVRIAADSAGTLLVAWTAGHVYSSVSTDKGVTWSPRLRVDDDTISAACAHADAFVQPGTNHYLVVATAPSDNGSFITQRTYLYRSTDMGQTFQPGVQLDTFGLRGGSSTPHVVADEQHIICDYTGKNNGPDRPTTEARTLYTEPDTWGSPSLVSKLDTSQFWSYYQGAKLAISADGRVHTALMVCCDTTEGLYLPFYVYSSDHGATWSELELANDDTTADSWDPDIAVDSAGNAYIVWQQDPGLRGEIWFATNAPLGIADETSPRPTGATVANAPTIVRGVLLLDGLGTRSELPERNSVMSRAALLDVGGRQVMVLRPGANDVRALAPGVYFVREAQAHAVRKVVVTR